MNKKALLASAILLATAPAMAGDFRYTYVEIGYGEGRGDGDGLFIGGAVEPRLGRWRYVTVYLLSALGGSVLSYAVDSPFQASVGASGAVFGLFGALFVLMRRLRFEVGGLISIIVINVVIGQPLSSSGGGAAQLTDTAQAWVEARLRDFAAGRATVVNRTAP